MLEWLRTLGSIVFIDLVLSGDNALVIGAVAAGLSPNLRWIAFLAGGGGAILLRIVLTYSTTLLLHIPLLQTIGGILLLIVTVRLLLDKGDAPETQGPSRLQRFLSRINIPLSTRSTLLITTSLTLLAADVSTSLDNIIAVAALAKDSPLLLFIGLGLSVLFLLVASALLSNLVKRLPWILLIAAAILTITGAHMILQETQALSSLLTDTIWWKVIVYCTVLILMTFPAYTWYRNHMLSLIKHTP